MEDSNIGDPVIVDTCEFLVKKICEEKHIQANISKNPLFPPPNYEAYAITRFLRKRCRKVRDIFGQLYTYLTFRLYFMLPNNILTKYYEPIIKKSDAVIFAGGGMLKYVSQEFWAADFCILKYCKKYNVPVYFNAIGIEGYDDRNIFSRLVKKMVNDKCVKAITTRDDIESLLQFKPDVTDNAVVGDPALWSSSLYKRNFQQNLIGIGTIRAGIFRVNGRMIAEKDLIDFYVAMIDKLNEQNQRWQLFTNGTSADYNIGLKILERLGIEPNEKVIAPQPKTSQELISLITQYKGIIANRMHAHIIATSFDIPTVGFIWNDKIKWFAKHLGIENRFFDCDEMKDSDKIFSTFENLLETGNNIQDRVTLLKNKTKDNLEEFIVALQQKQPQILVAVERERERERVTDIETYMLQRRRFAA